MCSGDGGAKEDDSVSMNNTSHRIVCLLFLALLVFNFWVNSVPNIRTDWHYRKY
jgi:hypothetical protein